MFLCTLKPDCFIVLSSEYSIKRHIHESHPNLNSNNPYKVIKGQALEINKFFFEVKLNNPLINSLISDNPNNTTLTLIEPLEKAKEVFLATYQKKEDAFISNLYSFKLDPKDKLSPFQAKTKYVEYISKYPIKDLVDLVSPLKEGEEVLEVLILNLKEVLYLSLDKTTFLSKIHLNILNSFEANKIKNKGFKALLTSNSRIKYFKLS